MRETFDETSLPKVSLYLNIIMYLLSFRILEEKMKRKTEIEISHPLLYLQGGAYSFLELKSDLISDQLFLQSADEYD